MAENFIPENKGIPNGEAPRPRAPHPFFDIGTENKGPSIAPRIKELEGVDDITETLQEKEVSKHEIYAITGFLVKGVMTEVGKAMQNKDIVSVNAMRMTQDKCPALCFDGESLRLFDGWQNTGKIGYESIWNARIFLKYFVEDILAGDIGSLSQAEDAAFKRLDDLVKQKKKWNRKHADDYTSGASLIRAGIGTASEETWQMMNVLPVLFYEQFGRDITEEEFDQLMESGGETLLRIASLPIYNLSSIGSGEKKRKPYQYLELAQERYQITGAPGALELSFQENFLNKAFITSAAGHFFYDHSVEPRHGCPVRDIRLPGQNGKLVSGIQAVVDFYRPLAKQVILPYQNIIRDASTK